LIRAQATRNRHLGACSCSRSGGENRRVEPFTDFPDAAKLAADKIEARLVGDRDYPVEFTDDEAVELPKALTAIVVGCDTPELRALYAGFADRTI